MKNCDEMVSSLLERREQYAVEQKKKRKVLIRAVTSVSCVCIAALLSFGVWRSGIFNTTAPESSNSGGIYAGGNGNDIGDTFCGHYEVIDNNGGTSQDGTGSPEASSAPTADTNNNLNDLCDINGIVVVDGVTYVRFEADAESYTLDTCLGSVGDYKGTCQTCFNDITGKLYTTKEDQDVLVVKLTNSTVVLRKEK